MGCEVTSFKVPTDAELEHDFQKNWKFRVGDLDDRALWDEYTTAYRDAIGKCSTKSHRGTSCPPITRTRAT